MARTPLAALPAAVIPGGATLTLPVYAVPAAVSSVQIELDGSAWPPGTDIDVAIDYSIDGGLTWWLRYGSIRATNISLGAGKCSVALGFAAPTGGQEKLRGSIRVVAGAGIVLAGSVTVL